MGKGTNRMMTAAIDRVKVGIAIAALVAGAAIGAVTLQSADATETEGVLAGCVSEYTGLVRIAANCSASEYAVTLEGDIVIPEAEPREPVETEEPVEEPEPTATPRTR